MGTDSLALALVILASVGLISSMLGYWEYLTGSGTCDISSILSCSTVYYIPQARILGVHLSEAAPVYFLALSGAVAFYGLTGSRGALIAAFAMSVAGAALVPYLVYLEVAVAGAICIFCTIMHVSIVGVLLASRRLLSLNLG